MFGIFLTLFDAASCAYGGMKNLFRNSQYQAQAINEGREYYIDSKGRTFSTKTNRQLFRTYSGSDIVYEDIKTGEIVINISAEHRRKQKEEEDAKRKQEEEILANKIAECSVEPIDVNNNPVCLGQRYIDKETKEIYVVRTLGLGIHGQIFIKESNGDLVRFTDATINYMNDLREQIEKLHQTSVQLELILSHYDLLASYHNDPQKYMEFEKGFREPDVRKLDYDYWKYLNYYVSKLRY